MTEERTVTVTTKALLLRGSGGLVIDYGDGVDPFSGHYVRLRYESYNRSEPSCRVYMSVSELSDVVSKLELALAEMRGEE